MKEFDDYCFTYSELCDLHFDKEEDWLEFLSPEILEAFNEYNFDQDYKEDYQ